MSQEERTFIPRPMFTEIISFHKHKYIMPPSASNEYQLEVLCDNLALATIKLLEFTFVGSCETEYGIIRYNYSVQGYSSVCGIPAFRAHFILSNIDRPYEGMVASAVAFCVHAILEHIKGLT